MSLASKGSRPIVVDGVAYRWRVRKKPTYGQALEQSRLLLAVELAEAPGATLVIELPQVHPSNWLGSEAVPVLPSDVMRYVREALAAGWQPTKPGKTFCLSMREGKTDVA